MCAQQAISSTFSKSLGACVPRRQSLIDGPETCIAPASLRILTAQLAPCPSNESNTAGGERERPVANPVIVFPHCGISLSQSLSTMSVARPSTETNLDGPLPVRLHGTTDRRRRSCPRAIIDRRRPLGRRSRWRPPCRTCWGRAASRRPGDLEAPPVAPIALGVLSPHFRSVSTAMGNDLGVEPAASAHVPDLPPARYRAPRARYPAVSYPGYRPAIQREGIRGGTRPRCGLTAQQAAYGACLFGRPDAVAVRVVRNRPAP